VTESTASGIPSTDIGGWRVMAAFPVCPEGPIVFAGQTITCSTIVSSKSFVHASAMKAFKNAWRQVRGDLSGCARSWRMNTRVFEFALSVGITEADLLKIGRAVAGSFRMATYPTVWLDSDPEYPDDKYIVLGVKTGGRSPKSLARAREKAVEILCDAAHPSKWQYLRVGFE
jgi:hypothetical protein